MTLLLMSIGYKSPHHVIATKDQLILFIETCRFLPSHCLAGLPEVVRPVTCSPRHETIKMAAVISCPCPWLCNPRPPTYQPIQPMRAPVCWVLRLASINNWEGGEGEISSYPSPYCALIIMNISMSSWLPSVLVLSKIISDRRDACHRSVARWFLGRYQLGLPGITRCYQNMAVFADVGWCPRR